MENLKCDFCGKNIENVEKEGMLTADNDLLCGECSEYFNELDDAFANLNFPEDYILE